MKKFFKNSCFLVLISFVYLVFSNCGSQKSVRGKSNNDYNRHHFLFRDEGMSQLSYEDLAHPSSNWYVSVPAGRDIQLTGKGRVLIGTGMGYEEREITTGKKINELTSFPGTISARRLRNGNTILVGLDWQGKKGIVLVEVDATGAIQQLITYPGFEYVRLVRETTSGNFLITANKIVFEGNKNGEIVWRVKINGPDNPHAWQALRLGNGQTVVSTGFAKNFQLFQPDGKFADTIGGPAEVKPHFYAGFQVLANGNYVVTNWQGHGAKFGAIGTQLLEYNTAGKLVWSLKQDSVRHSSLQGVIVLDGLDQNYLHIEDADGKLVPVK